MRQMSKSHTARRGARSDSGTAIAGARTEQGMMPAKMRISSLAHSLATAPRATGDSMTRPWTLTHWLANAAALIGMAVMFVGAWIETGGHW